MRFAEAKQQFEIRYYLWAISDFQREIEESFPGFHSFKSGTIWETYQFMRLLEPKEKQVLAHALLKRFHPNAVKALGESMSPEEKGLLDRRDGFSNMRRTYRMQLLWEKKRQGAEARALLNLSREPANQFLGETVEGDKSLRSRLDTIFGEIPDSREDVIEARKLAGEKIKFISKLKLLKLVAEKFQAAFAGRCKETIRAVEIDPHLGFEVPCGDWMITTHFWFGRGSTLLNYSHSITSQVDVEQQGAQRKFMGRLVLGTLISFSSWLGLTSQIQWGYLTPEEAEAACGAALKLCDYFFGVAPKLLKGLEFEKLDKENC